MPPMAKRFLLPQEWSVGERECIGGFWYYWQHMTVRFLPTQEWSVGKRECVGGFWYYWRTHDCEDSCLRRNGLVGDGGIVGEYDFVAVRCIVPPVALSLANLLKLYCFMLKCIE